VETMMRAAQGVQQALPSGWRANESPERNLERLARTLEIHVPGMRGKSKVPAEVARSGLRGVLMAVQRH
jgi:hypothetical protein